MKVFGTIVAIFVVVGIFSVVGSIFTLYVWCVDLRWRAARQARRQAAQRPTA